jgi:hypothetical protein
MEANLITMTSSMSSPDPNSTQHTDSSFRGYYPDQHQAGYAPEGAYYDHQQGYQGDEYYDNQYYDQGHAAAGQQGYGYNG